MFAHKLHSQSGMEVGATSGQPTTCSARLVACGKVVGNNLSVVKAWVRLLYIIHVFVFHQYYGWDCHHQQKQTQRLIGGNYAG